MLKEFEIAGYDMPCVDLAVNVDVFPQAKRRNRDKRYELAGRRKGGHRHGGGSQDWELNAP